jgi:hypothetical protein
MPPRRRSDPGRLPRVEMLPTRGQPARRFGPQRQPFCCLPQSEEEVVGRLVVYVDTSPLFDRNVYKATRYEHREQSPPDGGVGCLVEAVADDLPSHLW